MVTIIAILLTDLLQGIIIGILVGLYFVIRAHYHASITLSHENNQYILSLNKDVSFLNKAVLRRLLLDIDENSNLLIDANKAQFIDHDIAEILENFLKTAPDDNINVEIEGLLCSAKGLYKPYD